MGKHKVLMTGATGYIASQLIPLFRKKYELTLLDVKKTDVNGNKVPGVKIADLADSDVHEYKKHFHGKRTVIHLAYYRIPGLGWNDWRKLSYQDERVNIDMAYNVYKLSHDAGVRRVVAASSSHAADWYEPLVHQGLMDTVYPDSLPLSDNFYGWAKASCEQMGFIFASGHFGRKLEIILLRIGAAREISYRNFLNNAAGYKRDLGAHISKRDLQQLFVKSVETEKIDNQYGIPFQIFYGISDNTRKFWSIANARRVIGYAPEDDSEVKYADDIMMFLKGRETV